MRSNLKVLYVGDRGEPGNVSHPNRNSVIGREFQMVTRYIPDEVFGIRAGKSTWDHRNRVLPSHSSLELVLVFRREFEALGQCKARKIAVSVEIDR